MSGELAASVDAKRKALEATLKAVFAEYRDDTGFHVESVRVLYHRAINGNSIAGVEVTQQTLQELQR